MQDRSEYGRLPAASGSAAALEHIARQGGEPVCKLDFRSVHVQALEDDFASASFPVAVYTRDLPALPIDANILAVGGNEPLLFQLRGASALLAVPLSNRR